MPGKRFQPAPLCGPRRRQISAPLAGNLCYALPGPSPEGGKRMKYMIAIINQSTVVSDREVRALLPALQKQLDKDFAPAWGIKARLKFARQAQANAYQVYIKDRSDEEGDLGYHYTEEGLPVTYLFAVDDMADGAGIDGLSTTLSHELLEMLADPNANLYAEGYYYDRRGKQRPAIVGYEVCDPVEADSYRIDGVAVSNFVKPEWFEPEHPVGMMKFDYLGNVDAPFKLAVGGYIDALAQGKLLTVWGKEARRKKTRHRHMKRAHRQR
jgi:hypothetical protein